MPESSLNTSLVRLLTDDSISGQPVGAGFLVTNRHILTCAHVVCDALGINRHSPEMPDEILFLDFPLLEKCPRIRAKVIRWYPVQDDTVCGEKEDIAVLEILPDTPLPGHARPVPVVVLSPAIFDEGRSVRMCGFPEGMDEGDRRSGNTGGLVGTGRIQIDFEAGRRTAAPGFSGTPVWDVTEKSVCGMIVSINTRDGETSAYMIPSQTLVCAFPELDPLSRPANPYRGLEAFREKDASLFFGRETIVEDLSGIVQKQPLVPVIGASGSGKSSLIFAGLIPNLRDSGNWIIRDFRPKESPFYNLSLSLLPLLYKDKLEQLEKIKELPEKLRLGKIGLTDIIHMIVQEYPQQKLLLFADQFEELFTANPDKSFQRRFLDILLEPFSAPSLPFKFLFTMRADFMSQALDHAPFARELDKYKPKILSSMNEDGLTAVIEKPAEKSGVKPQTGLTPRILDDLGNEPGNLPLLEFALTQLWEMQASRTLTHEAYDRIGGVKNALARHADDVLKQFEPEQKKQLRQVFIQLVHPGQGTEDTRQVAFQDRFSEEKLHLIRRMADERLVVTGRNGQDDRKTVEVVHEALIKNWKPLQEWMNEDREFLIWQNNLRQAIADWEKTGKDDGALLRGVRLADAEEKLAERKEELGPDEIDFIQAGINLRQKEIENQKRRKTITSAAVAIFVLVTSVLGIFGYVKSIEADKQKITAEKNAERASRKEKEANEKLIEAQHNLGYVFYEKSKRALEDEDFNRHRLYALYALANFDPARSVDEKTAAINNIINQPNCPIIFSSPDGSHHTYSVNSVSFSPDGNLIASASEDATIRLWNVKSGELIRTLVGHTAFVNSVSFSPDGNFIASASNDNTIRLWDVKNGEQIRTLDGHTDNVNSVSFSPDGNLIASGAGKSVGETTDNTIRLWDVKSGKQIRTLVGHSYFVNSVSFSPDGNFIASSSWDQTIRLWNVKSGQQIRTLAGHSDGVNSVSFSPDGNLIASASVDETIRLWDVKSGRQVRMLAGHTTSVNSVSFSPDGNFIASASTDNTIRLWDVKNGEQIRTIDGHTSSVNSVSFSPDGNFIASASDDNTIRLWDVKSGELIRTLDGHTDNVNSVSFSPDGNFIASASFDNTIRLWDVKSGELIRTLVGHTSYVNSVSFSRDGKFIASASDDKTIRLWNLPSLYNLFDKLEDRKLIEKEIEEAEQRYNLQLVNLELQPIPPKKNLYGIKAQPPRWSKRHSFYWLKKAENGDTEAMVELGLIYDRNNQLDKAYEWYSRAVKAGSERAGERMKIFKQWLMLFKEKYPKEYEKYCYKQN